MGKVTEIIGIGEQGGSKLAEAGIRSSQRLLTAGATAKGRQELAARTGIGTAQILTWVNHADLFRIKGIGQQYADLLEAAGVDTVPELAQRNAANLYHKLTSINEERKLVRKMPVLSQVEAWVAQAKELPRVVNY
mgnify:CR=1 FL=1